MTLYVVQLYSKDSLQTLEIALLIADGNNIYFNNSCV
jgi:hypothetical protein